MLARALAAPMPRRRAVGLISGALVAASVVRPTRARAATCTGDTPKKCSNGKGSEVCTTADGQCCETPTCMMACRGYQTCTSPTCSDTPRICGHPDGPWPNGNRPKYCSVQSTVTFFCTESKPASVTTGWCCRGGEICGREYGDCTCRGQLCGEHLCCGEGEACESNFFGSRTECVFRCPRGQTQCGTDCCKDPLVCTPNGCDCPSGTVQRGVGRCVAPKEDPGPPGWNPFRDMANMMGASAASRGGGNRRRSVFARAAQSGSPAIDAALTALAATRGQAASAALAFRAGKDDPAFRRTVTVARVRPPTVSAGPGLDAASAAAITQLLAAEAKAYALAAASAKALWRARAAKAAHQRVFARRQMRASAVVRRPSRHGTAAGSRTAHCRGERALRRWGGRGHADRGSGQGLRRERQVEWNPVVPEDSPDRAGRRQRGHHPPAGRDAQGDRDLSVGAIPDRSPQ